MTAADGSRRLLLNGEALRIDVSTPPSGGGKKFEPQTAVDARRLLAPQLSQVIERTTSLTSDLRAPRQVYFEARLLPNYISASDYPYALLASIGAVSVGSKADRTVYRTASKAQEANTRRLVLAIEDTGLSALSGLVASGGGPSRSGQQAFNEIRKIDQLSVADTENVIRSRPAPNSGLIMWEAVLHPSAIRGGQPVPLDPETMERWFALVERNGGRVYRDYVRQVGGLTFSALSIDNDHADSVARFNPLRALRPMPAIRPRPIFGSRAVVSRVNPPRQQQPMYDAPAIAVFDGGMTPSTVLFPRNIIDVTTEPPDSRDLDHGTGVTGAVLCSLVKPGDTVAQPLLPVDTFRVLPAPHIPGDLEGYWVLDRIKEIVARGDHKIVNLSLGPELAVEDSAEPNRWTSELDQLAWESDVLFVVAAGNAGEADQSTGLHRVQVPADMANGLAVGACDAVSPDTPWQRAPYSSMGPGRQGNRIVPAGVQFGGTVGLLFPVVRADGSFLEASGTSFSAPLHTHALMDLVTRLPTFNPSILRAFSVHFTERPRNYSSLQEAVGYGRLPLTFVDHLSCGPDIVHVLFDDSIARGELRGYRLPIPGTGGPISLSVTMAYASPVEPSQPTEYTRASLELAFRPHHRMHRINPPRGVSGSAKVLNYTSAEAQVLFREGWEMSQEPITKSWGGRSSGAELLLRDSGKWETVRHSRVNLKAGEIEQARIEVSYVARRAGALDDSPPSIPFALLMTIKDPDKAGDLYDSTVAQFAALRPLSRARTQVRAQARTT